MLCVYISSTIFLSCSLGLICVILSQSGPDVSLRAEWGVNYRALNDLFEISQSRKGSISYEIGVQMVEIYNEQVRDLLSTSGLPKRYPTLNILILFNYLNRFLLMFNCLFSFSKKEIDHSTQKIITQWEDIETSQLAHRLTEKGEKNT